MAELKEGVKYDGGKLEWSLIPLQSLREIIKALMHGAKKYAPHNWMKVEHAKDRYWDAAMRHLTDWKDGEQMDRESGLNHLAHAGCCILFILWHDMFKVKDESK